MDTNTGPGGTPPFLAPGSTPPAQPGLAGPAAAKPGMGSNIMKILSPISNPGMAGAMSPIIAQLMKRMFK